MKTEESKEVKDKKTSVSAVTSFFIIVVLLLGIAYLFYNRFTDEKYQSSLIEKNTQLQITEYRCGKVLYIFIRSNNTIVVINNTEDSVKFANQCLPAVSLFESALPISKELQLFKPLYNKKNILDEFSLTKK